MVVNNFDNVEVYVARSKGYRWLTHLDHFNVADGKEFESNNNFEFYVVGVATRIYPGTLRIRAWVEKGE